MGWHGIARHTIYSLCARMRAICIYDIYLTTGEDDETMDGRNHSNLTTLGKDAE